MDFGRAERALACPASLKGVLGASGAAEALVEGFAAAGVEAEELPVADGGEGTLEALHAALGGEWREATVSDPLGRPVRARWLLLPDGTGVVESAQAIGLPLLDPAERDPLRASSRGLGELIHQALDAGVEALLVCLGGVATVDGGAGVLEILGGFPVPTRVACDVRSPLLDAARLFAAQKGASPEDIDELELRLASMPALQPFAQLPGAGAAGGLGAALAALGGELVRGPEVVLEAVGFRERVRGAALAITGEGIVDRTTAEGKAPAVVVRVCREERVRCAVFGGRIDEPLEGAELYELSGDPSRAREDLLGLGERLGRELVE